MSILTKLVNKNLILNKRRTIVTIISIILSCALIGGVSTLVVSFQRFMQDIEIESSGNYHATFKNVPQEKVKYVENNAYLKSTMKSVTLGYSELKGSNIEYKPYLRVLAFDADMFENMPVKLIDGRLPKNSTELLISEHIESNGGVKYKIGDNITLGIGKRYVDTFELGENNPYVNNEEEKEYLKITNNQQYKIVGVIERPSFESYNSPGYTVITYLTEGLLSSSTEFDISVITKNPKNIYDKLNDIAASAKLPFKEGSSKVYDIEYHNSLLRWYGVTNNDNANVMLYSIALILIGVIMIASIIVIYNSFNISITERKKQFGMLASIGTTSKQIRNMVLKEGLLLSLIGIPLGIIGSIIGIGITLKVVNGLGIFDGFFETRLELTISVLSILVTIVFGGFTIFLSSLIPAVKASKTSPIDAIRLTNDIKIKSKKLRTPRIIKRLFGIEGELAFKNMKRNRKKYRSTIISLFVSIILFMTVNSFAEYAFRSTLKVYNNYNFNVGVMGDHELLNEISKFDNIDEYSIVDTLSLTILVDENQLNDKVADIIKENNYNQAKQKYFINVNLSTLGEKEFNKYLKENNLKADDYNDLSNPKMIIIDKSNFYNVNSNRYYQVSLTNLREGDKVNLMNGDIDVKTMSIGKVTSNYPLGFTNTDSPTQSILAFISNDVYDSLDDSLKDGQPLMYIQSSNPEKLMKQIEDYSKLKGIEINAQNINEQIKLMNNLVLAIQIFLYGFITLVSLITITNVINTITTSIYLRRREFATIKAVGMTDKDFNKMISFESLFYGLKSLLYGLPFGIFIDYFMFKNVSSFFVYDYVFPYKPVFICVIFVFIIISITMTYSVRKIKNDNIIDVIKQENL